MCINYCDQLSIKNQLHYTAGLPFSAVFIFYYKGCVNGNFNINYQLIMFLEMVIVVEIKKTNM